MKEVIDVFLASDKAYYSGLFVALESCAANCSESLRFTIVMNEPDSRTNSCLSRIRAKDNVEEVRVVSVESVKGLSNYKGRSHFSKMAFARLLMQEIYEEREISTVLYLDPDIIVHVDVANLWKLKGQYPLMMSDQDNSGVMLIDIEYWRLNSMDQKCIEVWQEMGESFKHPDQDLLIHLFNQKGLCGDFDHSVWNLGSGYWNGESKCIIHCIGGRKPWHDDYKYLVVRDLFDQYYQDIFGVGSLKRRGALLSSLSRRWNNFRIKFGLK